LKTIYIDGNVDVSEPATGTIDRTTDQMILGNFGFNGQMDEVRIYPVGLSQSEVQDVMNNNTAPNRVDRATVTITISSVNDKPVAVDDIYEATINESLVVAAPGVLANDSDVEMDILSATVAVPPAIGSLDLALDGGFIYTPTLDFTGLVTYTYIASDGALTDTATVTMTVLDKTCSAYVNSSGQTFSGGNIQAVQNALDVAPAGDLIKIAGYCPIEIDSNGAGTAIALDQSVTLQGGYTNTNWVADPDPILYPTVLDGREVGTVVFITNTEATLSDLTISSGAAQDGGGIYVDTSAVTLSNTLLISNTAVNNGGSLYGSNSSITIWNSDILSNSTGNDGGGFYVDGSLYIYDSAFTNNQAGDNGGAINSGNGLIYITDSTVSYNTASGYGGGVYVDENGVVINNSLFEYNQAVNGEGGAIWVYTGGTIEGNSVIQHNMADTGGGIYASHGMLTIDSSTLYSNTATSVGGAIFLYYGSTVIKQSIINENYAGSSGGALFTNDDYPFIYIEDSHISNNTAVNGGGGLYISDECSLHMERSTLSGNQASNGGGLYLAYECSLVMVNSSVSANTAVNGGGIYMADDVTSDVEYSTITNNTATVAGGGVFLNGVDLDDYSHFTLRNTVLAGNSISGTLTHASADCFDLAGGFVTGGHNLFGSGTGCPADLRYDQTITPTIVSSTLLFPLADNGGAVLPDGSHAPSHALRDGSLAIDMGSDLLCPTSDQTGINRSLGNGCDIGSNESAFSELPFMPAPHLITVTTFADDLTVGDANCSLREAVNNANTDSDTTSGDCAAGNGWDTILLSAGTYSLTLPSTDEDGNLDGDLDIITDSLTIQGAGDTLTIIDANQDDRVIDHSHEDALPIALLLHDLTLTNGMLEEYGGCLQADAGLTLLVETIISDCSGTYGGGIYSYYGVVTLVDSKVMRSVGSEYGGGIYVENGTLSLYDSVVISNTAAEYGGGVYIDQTHLVLDNSDILSNTAESDGGGYMGNEAGLIMRNDSLVAYNVITGTDGRGGGVYAYSGSVIADSAISHNTSAAEGGGIYANYGGVWLSNSYIEHNQTLYDNGGGLYVGDSGIVQGSTIAGNSSATGNGGGLFTEDSTLLIRDTKFYSNTANSGGGLANDNGAILLFNGDVRWNTATTTDTSGIEGGGGIHAGDVGVLLVNTTVGDNQSASFGGGILAASAPVDIHRSAIAHNTAITGGGLYNNAAPVSLLNSTLSGNEADAGAGSYNSAGAGFYVHYSTIAANSATGNGGGVYNLGTVVIENSILAGNSANGSAVDASADCLATAPFAFAGYSLFGSGTGCAATGVGDITVDPTVVWTAVFNPLADNGGDTETHALLNGSPAIDAGNPAYPVLADDYDQRGMGFARVVNGRLDIGAYEAGTYMLTAAVDGTGDGTVTSSPAGIDCGDDCTFVFDEGTVVTLTAVSSPNSTFAGWSGDCSGTDVCVVTMTAAQNVMATFDETQFYIFLPVILK